MNLTAHEPKAASSLDQWPAAVAQASSRGLIRLLPLAGWIGFLMMLGGCTFLKPVKTETRHYILTAAPPSAPAATTNAGYQVRIRPVELADYLNTRAMAVRLATNEISFAQDHRWAEPLDAGLRRAVAENLRAAPRVRLVLTDSGAAPPPGIYNVSIQALACEGVRRGRQGSVAFVAAWQISNSGADGRILDHGVFRAQPAAWDGQDYGALARQLSRAVGEFSSAILDAIFRQPVSIRPR